MPVLVTVLVLMVKVPVLYGELVKLAFGQYYMLKDNATILFTLGNHAFRYHSFQGSSRMLQQINKIEFM